MSTFIHWKSFSEFFSYAKGCSNYACIFSIILYIYSTTQYNIAFRLISSGRHRFSLASSGYFEHPLCTPFWASKVDLPGRGCWRSAFWSTTTTTPTTTTRPTSTLAQCNSHSYQVISLTASWSLNLDEFIRLIIIFAISVTICTARVQNSWLPRHGLCDLTVR